MLPSTGVRGVTSLCAHKSRAGTFASRNIARPYPRLFTPSLIRRLARLIGAPIMYNTFPHASSPFGSYPSLTGRQCSVRSLLRPKTRLGTLREAVTIRPTLNPRYRETFLSIDACPCPAIATGSKPAAAYRLEDSQYRFKVARGCSARREKSQSQSVRPNLGWSGTK